MSMSSVQRESASARTTTVAVVDPQPADYAPLLERTVGPLVRLQFLPTGRDALQLARTTEVDLWVIHMTLPDMSGLDLCAMLKAQSAGRVVYVVTDRYRAEDERAAWVHGASLFGCKPLPESWFTDWRRRHCYSGPSGTIPGELVCESAAFLESANTNKPEGR